MTIKNDGKKKILPQFFSVAAAQVEKASPWCRCATVEVGACRRRMAGKKCTSQRVGVRLKRQGGLLRTKADPGI
jgi:hypothetical protein